MDPIASKALVKPADSAVEQGGASATKGGESKFEKVRNRLQDEQAAQVKIPPKSSRFR